MKRVLVVFTIVASMLAVLGATVPSMAAECSGPVDFDCGHHHGTDTFLCDAYVDLGGGHPTDSPCLHGPY